MFFEKNCARLTQKNIIKTFTGRSIRIKNKNANRKYIKYWYSKSIKVNGYCFIVFTNDDKEKKSTEIIL